MAKRKPDPLAPDERARADVRRGADLGWLDLKREAAGWGTVEVVSGLDQQMRVTHASGAEVKIWRRGNAFAVAVNGTVLGLTFAALDALAEAVRYVKNQGLGG